MRLADRESHIPSTLARNHATAVSHEPGYEDWRSVLVAAVRYGPRWRPSPRLHSHPQSPHRRRGVGLCLAVRCAERLADLSRLLRGDRAAKGVSVRASRLALPLLGRFDVKR